jgi:hypothetical protein
MRINFSCGVHDKACSRRYTTSFLCFLFIQSCISLDAFHAVKYWAQRFIFAVQYSVQAILCSETRALGMKGRKTEGDGINGRERRKV